MVSGSIFFACRWYLEYCVVSWDLMEPRSTSVFPKYLSASAVLQLVWTKKLRSLVLAWRLVFTRLTSVPAWIHVFVDLARDVPRRPILVNSTAILIADPFFPSPDKRYHFIR